VAEAEAEEEEALESRPVLLDTNVLVYATNEDSPFHARARELVQQALAGNLDAALTPQILAEYYAVITDSRRVDRPLTPQEARGQIEALLDGAIRLLPLQEGTSRRMAELGERHDIRAQEIYDAQVVAAMLEGGIPLIWTANEQDFRRYQEIEVRNPFAVD
jgi:toxin-antitoxin system PIN domain toxin